MGLIKTTKIIAVARFDETETGIQFAEACKESGINLIEVISTKPGAFELIKILSETEDICVGAGTVLDLKSAEDAHSSGAEFIVSPHTDREIIEFAKSRDITSIAGAFTSSEIVNADKFGADYVKIFPASSVGPKYIKAIKEALPFIKIMVTGGINTENVKDYLVSGASLVGISTALTGSSKVFDKETVSLNAKKFVEAVK